MKIVIPMAGKGKRFAAAGYEKHKTLIEVEGRPIIEHVVRRFSPNDDFVFGINEDLARDPAVPSLLKKLAPAGKIVTMPYEKGGPIATVNNMLAEIKDDEPVIVNYADFSWVWDYADFKRAVQANGCDGAVVCYRGFHPHLLGPNKYATLDSDGLWMKEIREKHSWHDNKQKDWTSSGTYYFKKGAYIKKYFSEIGRRPDWRINGEHYVSQIFQLMKEDGLKVFIYEIPFMMQWGTPEDFEEYLYWSRYFHQKRQRKPDAARHDMEGLILMAGAGKRFQDAGYKVPKPYIEVDGGMMAARSAESLPRASRYVFVTREELRDAAKEKELQKKFSPSEIISLKKLTEGQACTALCAKEKLDLKKPLLIGACDHTLLYDSEKFKKAVSAADALIFTYRNNPNVRRNPQAYGWVDTDKNGLAKKVSVKEPLPGNPMQHHAVTGSFWFRKGSDFVEQAERMIRENSRIRNEFYIDQAMNYFISAGLKVYAFEADYYVSWGTPDDLKTYEYWERYFNRYVFKESAA